jgi:hypothetical protein
MATTLNAILESAYNGVCLATENGQTEDYTAADVSAPDFISNSFTVTLRDTGERITISVGEPQ